MDNLETIYRQHSFAVFRRCKHLLRCEAEAQEMTQEVFLRLLRNPQGFAGRAHVSTYLYAIATNLCLNRLRDGAARGASWQSSARYHDAQGRLSADPETHTLNADLVAKILAEEDATTALIAVYHYVDGLPQGEIAALVQLSRVTVNQRLGQFITRARKKLEVA